jgi:hypothetical protein
MEKIKPLEKKYTVSEIAHIYKLKENSITYQARKLNIKKFGGMYLFTEKQVNSLFKIPSVSDSVIYVNTVWEILPSKMNYLTIKQL